MSARRVVVTGIGLASPLGNDLPTAVAALREGRHGIVTMPEWAEIQGLSTRLAGIAKDVPFNGYPRKKTRSMGRVALLATYATERALMDAGLDQDLRSIPDIGLAYGSTHGSSSAQEEFCRTLFARNGMRGIPSTSYLKFMSNTCVVNLAHFFGIQGRVISTCAACTSASNAIGYGFEAIRSGQLDIMLCGGAEEMHFTHAVVFDILYATSRHFNDRPGEGSRPFDADRDGLVVAEGAGTLVLEEEERARRRGAHIHGEVIGFGTSCDGQHVTQPSADGMAMAMKNALARRAHRARRRRLHQRARDRDRHRRHHREPGHVAGVRGQGADQLDQGTHRPHAGRLRRPGVGLLSGDDERGLPGAHQEPRQARSPLRAASLPAK